MERIAKQKQFNSKNRKLNKSQINESQDNSEEKSKQFSGARTIINPESQTEETYIRNSLFEADRLWKKINQALKDNPNIINLNDNDKISFFYKDHSEFQKEFPIVARYMICMGQYREKAFIRFLKKCKNTVGSMSRQKGEAEDQWVMRQADYVRYLWEECQTGRFSAKEAQAIWKQAYELLSKEFKDFRNMHKDKEKEVKKNNIVAKKELVKEMLIRHKSGEQLLSEEQLQQLINMLKN